MGKYDLALKKLQEERLEVSGDIETKGEADNDLYLDLGFLSGIEKAEEILYDLQKQTKDSGQKLWYTGSPNDIKPNNRGTYVLIMKANFDSDDGIDCGDIKIDTDFWNGEDWEVYEVGDEAWEILYFTKLKWLMFPLPESLGMKRSDSLFFN